MAIILAIGITSPAQQVDKGALLRQGDDNADALKWVAARQAYDQAIAAGADLQQDYTRSRNLGLAYMSGDPRDFVKAAKWFQVAIALDPKDRETQVYLAQTLSWSRQFEPAIAKYRELLQSQPDDNTVKLQLARVLSWAKDFPGSIALYDELVGSSPEMSLRVERARVLSWQRKFPEAKAAYEEVLKSDPTNLEAKVGLAQVLYWSGDAAGARPIVEQVLQVDPNNSPANLLMASLEHNSGNDASARMRLQRVAPDDYDKELHDSILADSRPVLRMQFGYGNEREEPTGGLDSTYRTLRYIVGIEFDLTRRIRMDISNVVSQNNTSTLSLGQYGADAISTQTMVRLTFPVYSWLRLTVGAGAGTTGTGVFPFPGGVQAAREGQFLFDFHPTITRGAFRMDLSATRTIADATPLAVQTNLVQQRDSVNASYTIRKRVRIGGEYWYANYSMQGPDPSTPEFDTHANGGSVYVLPILYHRERFSVEAGVKYDVFRFADQTVNLLNPAGGIGASGVFMPQTLQRYYGTAEIMWSPLKHLRTDFYGTFGPQRVYGFAALTPPPAVWGNTGSIGTRLTLTGHRFQPYVGYEYFSTGTPSSPGLVQGSYFAHYGYIGMRYRF